MRSLRVALVAAVAVLLPAAPAWAQEGPTTAALTPIAQLVQDRGLIGTLGPVTVPERAIAGGRQQDHQNGLVVQRNGAGPLAVGPQAPDPAYTSKFGTAYTRAGGATGELGFPLADVACGGWRAYACMQPFEGGTIVRSVVSVNTLVVRQIIEDGWVAAGREDGALGLPGVQELAAVGGGAKQHFEGGTVYWSAATGSHAVTNRSGFRDVHGFVGVEGGRLGYPTSDEVCGLPGGGCFQKFQGGSLYRTVDTGPHIVAGAIRDAWARQGWEAGRLGYPTTDDICGLRGGGCLQKFQGGFIYWSPTSGAHVVLGAIRTAYGKQGWETGRLGYPTTDERCGLRGGGCFQGFQRGAIYWSPASGAHAVLGAIREGWARQRWETGRLGYPTTDERCGLRGGGCFQEFQGGAMYWSRASGAHAVVGGIRDAWARQGWEAGRLGYPIGGESFSGSAYRQTFQGGTITISARGTQITYR